MTASSDKKALAYAIMIATPALFSTNIIFGRGIAGETTPFVLASIRWFAVGLCLALLSAGSHRPMVDFVRRHGWRIGMLALLGMGICGGGVYLGLSNTTATNATLIYSAAPLLILVLDGLFGERDVRPSQWIGSIIAFAGVAVVVLRGSLDTLLSLSFNIGDVLIALAALSWAAYSILYRKTPFEGLRAHQVFCLLALFGGVVNAPFAAVELARGAEFPHGADTWLAIAGIIFISSLLAFSGFQHGVRTLGASIAGVFMYLMTPFGVALAIVFLGETLQVYHSVGIVLVLAGIIATLMPSRRVKRD